MPTTDFIVTLRNYPVLFHELGEQRLYTITREAMATRFPDEAAAKLAAWQYRLPIAYTAVRQLAPCTPTV